MTFWLQNYGIGKLGLNLLLSYLSNWKQRTKVNSLYSDWHDIIRSVPQGSILGPLLFDLFISFFLKEQIHVKEQILLMTIKYIGVIVF